MTDLKSVKYDNDSKLLRQVPDANAVDAQLSLTSENAVQNKAIAAALQDKLDAPANAPQPGMALGVGTDYKPLWVPSAGDAQRYAEQAQAIYESILAVNTFMVGVPYGYGITVSGNVVSITWIDPSDFVSQEYATIARWQRTRLVMKHGGFPEDETDGEVLVDSTVRDQYRVTPFTVDMGSSSDYYFALFSCTTGGVWNTGDSAPRFTADALTWATIAMMTRAGTLMQYPGMAIGSVVDIPVNSLYPKLRYKLADVDYSGTFMEISDYMYDHTRLHNSIWIPNYLPCMGESNNAEMVQYDAPELSYAATWDEEFVSGKAYYTVSGETYTQLVAGTDYEIGGSIAEWIATEGENVYTKNHVSRIAAGYNSWMESNIRAALNGTGGGYWSQKNEYDVRSGNAFYASGWMTGFDPAFLSLVMPVYNKTARNTVASVSGGGGGGYDMTLDTFWLPSAKEVFNSNTNNIAEGAQFAYFRDVATTNASRIQRDEGGTARNVWLRSPNAGSVLSEASITTSGTLTTTSSALGAYAFLPAICL